MTEITAQRIENLEDAATKALIFFKDVIPQLGGIVIQDYKNMNDLGCLLEQLATKKTLVAACPVKSPSTN